MGLPKKDRFESMGFVLPESYMRAGWLLKRYVCRYVPIVPCCALTPRESGRYAIQVGFEGNGIIVVDLSFL